MLLKVHLSGDAAAGGLTWCLVLLLTEEGTPLCVIKFTWYEI